MKLVEWLIKNIDVTLIMRFAITLILLLMLYKALFQAEAHFDEAFKNVLVLLTGTTVGYFFNTSKGSTDKDKQLHTVQKQEVVKQEVQTQEVKS